LGKTPEFPLKTGHSQETMFHFIFVFESEECGAFRVHRRVNFAGHFRCVVESEKHTYFEFPTKRTARSRITIKPYTSSMSIGVNYCADIKKQHI
jgi:hypothetical protein